MKELVVDVAKLLEGYDQTDPAIQREVIATFCIRATIYEAALREILQVPSYRGSLAAIDIATEALRKKWTLTGTTFSKTVESLQDGERTKS